jgi:hypothetical protein
MSLPAPWDHVWDTTALLLAPALGASLVVMLAGRLLGRERMAPLAAALALAAGVLVGNHFHEAMNFTIDKTRPPSFHDLQVVLGWSLESKPEIAGDGAAGNVDYDLPIKSSHYWLPWMAGLALLVELLARLPGVPPSVGWAARTLLAAFAGRLLTPGFARVASPWLSWFLGVAILLEWSILLALARRWKDGTTAAAMALCCLAGAVLLLHAGIASLMDPALLFFAALLGLAIVAWWLPGDTGPALAAAAMILPSLLLIGRKTTDIEAVPEHCFLLVGLAPLAMTPLLLPVLARQQRWRRWLPAILLPLLPAVVGVVLAALAAPLDFSEAAAADRKSHSGSSSSPHAFVVRQALQASFPSKPPAKL